MKLTLLGEKLSHSLSPKIHEMIFAESEQKSTYTLSEVNPDDIGNFIAEVRNGAFDGLNVTIPYKSIVIPYLDGCSEAVSKIGAVNTIKQSGSQLIGYNTDVDGFSALLKSQFIEVNCGRFAVLGVGGAAKAVLACLDDEEAKEIVLVSRDVERAKQKVDLALFNADVQFETYDTLDLADRVCINTTPLGMYPNIEASPLKVEQLTGCLAVIDLIYNPEETKLVQLARELGIHATSGLFMLAAQAVRAQEIWQRQTFDEALVWRIYQALKSKRSNLVLIGMPGCGKSTIGKRLARQLELPLFDMDAEITDQYGDIPSLFKKGEAHFREIESEMAGKASECINTIICTGGGIIKNKENMTTLAENGTIVFIDRPVESILGDINHESRPLLDGKAETIKTLYDERIRLYRKYAHFTVDGSQSLEEVTEAIAQVWKG